MAATSEDRPQPRDGRAPPQAGPERGRFSARRKQAIVVRMLRGEPLETLSREVGVTAATLSRWRDQFLEAGTAALKSRPDDPVDDDRTRLQAKIGQLTMTIELLETKIDALEAGRPLARRRSSR